MQAGGLHACDAPVLKALLFLFQMKLGMKQRAIPARAHAHNNLQSTCAAAAVLTSPLLDAEYIRALFDHPGRSEKRSTRERNAAAAGWNLLTSKQTNSK